VPTADCVAICVALALSACGEPPQKVNVAWVSVAAPDLPDGAIDVPPPPFSPGVFPCSDCHDPELPVNTQRRELKTAHTEVVLRHDQAHRWCLDCHDAANRDMLHLANGTLVEFSSSYELCGQCHGDKYRDWRAGVHGRRVGQWNGAKSYLLCVHCHNSHSPAFAPLAPERPPQRPHAVPASGGVGAPP
jgi:hypothetical protein